jgi:hypothetical protein
MLKRYGLVLAAMAALVVTGTSNAEARALRGPLPADAESVDQRVTVRFASYPQPQAMPAPVAVPGCAAPVPAPCAPAPCVCCPTPCIKYRHAVLDLGRLCRPKCCKPPIKAVLATKNPCTCCPVDVPVCLPGCCCGEPVVDCRKTIVGEGLVTYSWCCGVSVSIRYKKCGEVLVTYRGV